MKEKYIEERFPLWHEISGRAIEQTGSTIVDNGNSVLKGDAPELMAEHNRAIEMIKLLANALERADPEAFRKLWYDGVPLPVEYVKVPEECTPNIMRAMKDCEDGTRSFKEAWHHIINAARIK